MKPAHQEYYTLFKPPKGCDPVIIEHPSSVKSPLFKSHSPPFLRSNNEKNRQHYPERSQYAKGQARRTAQYSLRHYRTRENFRQKGTTNFRVQTDSNRVMLTETYRPSNKEKVPSTILVASASPNQSTNTITTGTSTVRYRYSSIYLCYQISIRHPGRGARVAVAGSCPVVGHPIHSQVQDPPTSPTVVVSAHVPKLSKQSHYRSTTNSFAQCLLVAAISHVQPAAAKTFCFHLHSHSLLQRSQPSASTSGPAATPHGALHTSPRMRSKSEEDPGSPDGTNISTGSRRRIPMT